MDDTAAALGDASRWRLVELLAERPRSVGELAQLTGLRQPQTTKHLQTLARAGLVTVFPLGQRRVYALEPQPLTALADRLRKLAETTEGHAEERQVLARYRAAIEAESAAAEGDHWADGRGFTFERALKASREEVWRYWVDPVLLASWWVPRPLTVTACVLEPRPGGRALLDYRDADGEYRSEGQVLAAEEPERLTFDMSVTWPASFTAHYDLKLTESAKGTHLHLDMRLEATTVAAVPAIAAIETGWNEVLDNLTEALTEGSR
ncbi:metalloregulator ArsR/SmtB family transcription factor [Amycolatopsis nalaikhensis]|uniref:Metalloregulator ArsR/SmtB family transcription factor n=1 Tax=Amycolatopsis nalaikhensis TaxID=715472 RepID=A0ABY8XA33_9PSEU|nr:metalloregulator ArsR/SmtB family transcription factor [Amycolatopsis sp. 2-2]WIV53272.1 metalloregulator ArsR/SmtB family transcription factor [Amycolatopsis sp. 2-2]